MIARPLCTLLIGAAFLEAGCAARAPATQPAVFEARRVFQDVEYLASDSLGGRMAGTAGSVAAAVFVAERLLSLPLVPAFTSCDSAGDCRRAPFQRFELPSPWQGHSAVNVAAVLGGSDPKLRHELLVIGAHYDHLGQSDLFAPGARSAGILVGADDNASGTAALLELARRLAERPPRRSVLFIAFGAEEMGLIGSTIFVENSPVSLDSVTAMLNLDMVGRLRRQQLNISGLRTSPPLDALVDSANAGVGLTLRKQHAIGRSDHVSFWQKGIPVLHFFTGYHADYHTSRDRADRINTSGLIRVIDLAEAVARMIADRPERLARGN